MRKRNDQHLAGKDRPREQKHSLLRKRHRWHSNTEPTGLRGSGHAASCQRVSGNPGGSGGDQYGVQKGTMLSRTRRSQATFERTVSLQLRRKGLHWAEELLRTHEPEIQSWGEPICKHPSTPFPSTHLPGGGGEETGQCKRSAQHTANAQLAVSHGEPRTCSAQHPGAGQGEGMDAPPRPSSQTALLL